MHEKRAPVLNGIHFEHTRIDLTDVPRAQIGDEVVLFVKQGDQEITLQEIVRRCETDLHVFCQSIREHIPCVYIKEGRPYKITTPLEETVI